MALSVHIKKKLKDFELAVDFDMDEGIVGFLGSSGCGKSMTLKCIAGIETPDEGRIVLDDEVLFDKKSGINLSPQKRKVGYLFQNYALFPHMTVKQNIEAGLAASGKSKQEKKEIVERLLEQFHIKELENSYPVRISGGQQQRAALARMMAAEPKFLLLDEPFSALDEHIKRKMEREVMEMLHDFGKPILFVSHNQEEVYRLADRIGSMENGRFSSIREKREFFAEPQTAGQAKLVGCNNISKIDWISKDQVYAKEWNLLLRVPSTEPEDRKRYRAIAIYPGDIVLSKERALEWKKSWNRITISRYSISEELRSWSVSCQMEGTKAELMMLLSKEKVASLPEKITEICISCEKIHLLQ